MNRPQDISKNLWEAADIYQDMFRGAESDIELIARVLAAERAGRAPAGLTPAQAGVFGAIAAYKRDHGYGPSVRDIGRAVGLSGGNVHRHVKSLIERGVVSHIPNRARSITILAGM